MTLNRLIEYVETTKPGAFSKDTLTFWLSEVEASVKCDIMGIDPSNITEYDYDTDQGTELLLPLNFVKLYYLYITAMQEFSIGNYPGYKNAMALYESAYSEYAKWYLRNNGGEKN